MCRLLVVFGLCTLKSVTVSAFRLSEDNTHMCFSLLSNAISMQSDDNAVAVVVFVASHAMHAKVATERCECSGSSE